MIAVTVASSGDHPSQGGTGASHAMHGARAAMGRVGIRMLRDALLYASRLETPWRQLFCAGLCLIAPLILLLLAVGTLYVGVAACGIGLVVGVLGAPFWLFRLLRRLLGRPAAARAPLSRDRRQAQIAPREVPAAS